MSIILKMKVIHIMKSLTRCLLEPRMRDLSFILINCYCFHLMPKSQEKYRLAFITFTFLNVYQ